MSIRSSFLAGGARLDRANRTDYTEREAKEAFDRFMYHCFNHDVFQACERAWMVLIHKISPNIVFNSVFLVLLKAHHYLALQDCLLTINPSFPPLLFSFRLL